MKSIFNNLFSIAKTAITDLIKDLDSAVVDTNTTDACSNILSSQSNNGSEARDTIIVVDRSYSMDYTDYFPSRLQGGIDAAIEYINARFEISPNDRIALVAFNERAKILSHFMAISQEYQLITLLNKLKPDNGTDISAGLNAAIDILQKDPPSTNLRQIILLTDGFGGRPLNKAKILKNDYQSIIDVVGIGGSPKSVNESLLRQVATTDGDGFNHYRFIKDSHSLKKHYRNIATGLVWKGAQK